MNNILLENQLGLIRNLLMNFYSKNIIIYVNMYIFM
jgi:hypothetical protein